MKRATLTIFHLKLCDIYSWQHLFKLNKILVIRLEEIILRVHKLNDFITYWQTNSWRYPLVDGTTPY